LAAGRGLAAALSFLVWGLGHLWAGRGRHYGLAVFAHMMMYFLYSLILPGVTLTSVLLLLAPLIALSAFFAYDVYGRAPSAGPAQAPQPTGPASVGGSPQPRFCHSCGTRLRESARFCHSCGSPAG
jgi:hypothetical protein